MKKLIIIVLVAAALTGCMGNTINYITIENGGAAGIENHEDGNTNDLDSDLEATVPLI